MFSVDQRVFVNGSKFKGNGVIVGVAISPSIRIVEDPKVAEKMTQRATGHPYPQAWVRADEMFGGKLIFLDGKDLASGMLMQPIESAATAGDDTWFVSIDFDGDIFITKDPNYQGATPVCDSLVHPILAAIEKAKGEKPIASGDINSVLLQLLRTIRAVKEG